MFIRFFKDNNPSSFFLLPAMVAVLWIVSFIEPTQIVNSQQTMLYTLLAKPVMVYPFINSLVSFLIVVAEGLVLNQIVNSSEIITRRTFLPALFYIVWMSNNPSLLCFHPALIANLFLILCLNSLLTSFRRNNAFSNAFDAGLFLAFASMLYFPSIILFPVIFIGLIIFRTYNWREWLISILGFAVPYSFVFTYYFWFDKLPEYWKHITSYFVYHDKPSFDFPSSFYLMFVVGCFIVLLALSQMMNFIRSGSQKTKKNLIFINWFLLFAILSIAVAPDLVSPNYSVLAIPLSVFTANYFLNMKKEWLGELLFLFFQVTILISDFSKYF